MISDSEVGDLFCSACSVHRLDKMELHHSKEKQTSDLQTVITPRLSDFVRELPTMIETVQFGRLQCLGKCMPRSCNNEEPETQRFLTAPTVDLIRFDPI